MPGLVIASDPRRLHRSEQVILSSERPDEHARIHANERLRAEPGNQCRNAQPVEPRRISAVPACDMRPGPAGGASRRGQLMNMAKLTTMTLEQRNQVAQKAAAARWAKNRAAKNLMERSERARKARRNVPGRWEH